MGEYSWFFLDMFFHGGQWPWHFLNFSVEYGQICPSVSFKTLGRSWCWDMLTHGTHRLSDSLRNVLFKLSILPGMMMFFRFSFRTTGHPKGSTASSVDFGPNVIASWWRIFACRYMIHHDPIVRLKKGVLRLVGPWSPLGVCLLMFGLVHSKSWLIWFGWHPELGSTQ